MASLKGMQTPLRRHGDEFERLPGGFYRALGRCDDTMNLGGIKVGYHLCRDQRQAGDRNCNCSGRVCLVQSASMGATA